MALNRRISEICAISALLPITLLAQADRISGQVDTTHLVKLTGNVKPQAKSAADQGPLDPATKLNYVQLILKPSAAQQSELNQLLIDQQKRGSPDFRKWLTPEQFADRFGVSQADIAKITGWMQSQGFDIITVGRGRRFIAFNATVSQIQSTLKTEIHRYTVNGESHFANTTDPSVPEAIQPLALGFSGLDDFQPKAHVKSTRSATAAKPMLADGGQNVLGPEDLAIIYDLIPIWQLGYTGSGQYIAAIGRSDVQLSDIETFRSDVGLPANDPELILVPGATDPGLVSGDQGESDLDLEYAGGIAYDAQVLFVYATQLEVALKYAIDQAVAPVITYSYGACEQDASSTAVANYQALAQQANAEGITWLASAGDQGAAACDTGGVDIATHGAAVNLEASIPEVTGVGGTMFVENGGNYWNSTNSDDSSVLGYIPETVWNETAVAGQLSAGGGGYSAFYTRGAWQVGPGVPAGTQRGVPDLSMAAAAQHDPYYAVENGGQFNLVGGTSAATPTFAAMILLLNQYLGTNGLGNINPNLYYMAQNTSGVFHDITTGWNGVPCAAGSPNCGSGGAFGFYATSGWDAASGLGSVDANQMFTQWNTGGGSPQISAVVNGASLTTTGLSPGLIFTIFGSALGPFSGILGAVDPSTNIVYNDLDYITVSVNGAYAPLLYVGPNQINAIAPYEIANSVGQNVSVVVSDNSINSNSFNVMVVATAPAMFSLGNGQAAILNQDGSVNGPNNPATRGSIVSIYATGEGQTNPAGVDGLIATEGLSGLPRPVASFSLTIGGASATYTYAGTAPQEFAGFFQVDAKIPSGIGTGSQPVILKVGSATSPPLNVVVQ
jgi:uncharacterized protein (TIGR03437 family)